MRKFILMVALSLLSSGVLAIGNVNAASADELSYSYEGETTYNNVGLIVKSQSIPSSKPIYEGTLDNILDGNSDTHAWFNGGFTTGDYFEVNLGVDTFITSIKIDNGKKVSTGFGDYLSGYLQYVSNDGQLVNIENTTLQRGSNIFDFRNGHEFNASKIRLVLDYGVDDSGSNITSSSWGALSSITINPLNCEVSYEGSRVIQDGSLNSMVDGDIYTFARFNREPTSGTPTFQLTLDYYEVKNIAEINVTNGSYNLGDTNYLEGIVEYSTDKVDWFNAGNIVATEQNVLNFRDSPIEARYLRITDKGVIRWIAIRNVGVTFADSEPTISYEGNRVLQNGVLGNIIDGNDNTYARFNRVADPTFQVTVDYKNITVINSVRVLNGAYNTDGNNFVKGSVQYSSDNITYYELGVLEGREVIYDLSNSPIEARYIRVIDNASYRWVALREISINIEFPSDFTTVTYDGFTFVEEDSSNKVSSGGTTIPYGTSVTNIADNDLSSYAWFDWRCSQGAYILLDLRDVKTIDNIVLFQGNQFHINDMFADATIYASLDGNEFEQVGDDHYENQSEIFIDLSSSPIRARYLKVVSNIVNPNGVVIRQFSANFEKYEANIEFDNKVAYTYNGEALTPTFTIPEGTSATVHYEHNEAFYGNDAPVAPGWYSLVVVVNETNIYKETTKYTVFHIDDESLTALTTLINSLDTCVDYDRAQEVRTMYEALSDDILKETFENTICAEDENCTMLNKLIYMEQLSRMSSYNNSSIHLSTQNDGDIMLIIVVISTLFMLVGIPYLIKVRKNYSNN